MAFFIARSYDGSLYRMDIYDLIKNSDLNAPLYVPFGDGGLNGNSWVYLDNHLFTLFSDDWIKEWFFKRLVQQYK